MAFVQHGGFALERTYPASPARVFAAFSTKEGKSRWFNCFEELEEAEVELDFREGGRELNRLKPPGRPPHVMQGLYHHIVPGERFVLSFTLHIGERLISVSLMTVEVRPEGEGARLTVNEHGAFFEEGALAEREEGTAVGLDRLAGLLAGEDRS